MRRKITTTLAMITLLLFVTASVSAESMAINILEFTPVGSWQVRESTQTQGNKTTTSITKTSLIGEETRDNVKCYWIEMETENFKVKKNGKRKADGEKTIMKILLSEDSFKEYGPALVKNFKDKAKEIIMKSGDSKAMKIPLGGDSMFSAMFQSMNVQMDYAFKDEGAEKMTTPAGSFDTIKYSGSGTTEAQVFMQKIKVEGTTMLWISKKVPFGIVQSQGTSVSNNNTTTFEEKLLEFGTSGATSQITGPVEEMQMPSFSFGK